MTNKFPHSKNDAALVIEDILTYRVQSIKSVPLVLLMSHNFDPLDLAHVINYTCAFVYAKINR